ncbi:MAG: hypothetical protein V1921_03315 [Candidatus Altiarchaeota archaeon]
MVVTVSGCFEETEITTSTISTIIPSPSTSTTTTTPSSTTTTFTITVATSLAFPEITVPMPKIPYTAEELKSITNITFIFENEDAKISDNILRGIFDKINPLIRTFTGEKYVDFSPNLNIVGTSDKKFNWTFTGKGYVDEINYDDYTLEGSRDIGWTQIIIGLTRTTIKREGVSQAYKNLTLDIIKQKSEVLDECPKIGSVKWNPEKSGYTLNEAWLPCAIECPSSLIIVNLNNLSVEETECEIGQKSLELVELFQDTEYYGGGL